MADVATFGLPADAFTATRDAPFRALTVDGLCFVANGTTILDDISVRLPPSGLTVLLGPNGAGKSVFLRLVNGLLAPTAGVIRWGDEAVSEATRLRQGFLFQKPVLLKRSALANLLFVLKLRGHRHPRGTAERLLAEAGLAALADRPARVLSGGERQRLALVRALATDPDVLLLDEPAAGLDPASTALLEETIARAVRRGVKVLLVTHDVAQARRLADDVLFLSRGRIAEHQPARDFFANPRSDEARAYLSGRLITL